MTSADEHMDIVPGDRPLTVEEARQHIEELFDIFNGKEDVRLLALAHEIVSQIECHCAPPPQPQPADVIDLAAMRSSPSDTPSGA